MGGLFILPFPIFKKNVLNNHSNLDKISIGELFVNSTFEKRSACYQRAIFNISINREKYKLYRDFAE